MKKHQGLLGVARSLTGIAICLYSAAGLANSRDLQLRHIVRVKEGNVVEDCMKDINHLNLYGYKISVGNEFIPNHVLVTLNGRRADIDRSIGAIEELECVEDIHSERILRGF